MIESILLALLLLLLAAKLAGALCGKLGLDSSIGELTVGVLLGPSVFNWVAPGTIEPFAIIGSVLILFVAGLKQDDFEEVIEDKKPLALGILLLIIVGGGMAVFFSLVHPGSGAFTGIQVLVLALAFAIIDIGVPAKVLIAKGLMALPVGKVAVRAAVVNIIIGLVLFTLSTLMLEFSPEKILGILLFGAIIAGLYLWFGRLAKHVTKLHIGEAEFSLAIILVLALAYLTEFAGFSSVLGAFLAGVLIAKLPFSGTRSFSDKVKSLSFGLFVPLFFVWFGLTINLSEIMAHFGYALLVFVLYALLRFGITYVYLKSQHLQNPALVGVSMLSVDVESLVVLMVAFQLGIFTDTLPFTIFAPSVFLSTLVIVVLVALMTRKRAQGPQNHVASRSK